MINTVQLPCSIRVATCSYPCSPLPCLHIGKLHACTRAARSPHVIGSTRGGLWCSIRATSIARHSALPGRAEAAERPAYGLADIPSSTRHWRYTRFRPIDRKLRAKPTVRRVARSSTTPSPGALPREPTPGCRARKNRGRNLSSYRSRALFGRQLRSQNWNLARRNSKSIPENPVQIGFAAGKILGPLNV